MKRRRLALPLAAAAAVGLVHPVEAKEIVMGGSKKAAGPEAPAREEFDVRGRHVVITRLNGREVVQVDGRVEGFYSTPDGYLLKRDVYRHPAKTLRAAVERYLEREVPAK